MTRGAVIFAYNNEHIDYLSMAVYAASRVKRFLKIPVCLITDIQNSNLTEFFDSVIYQPNSVAGRRFYSDLDTSVKWYNQNRMSVYDLSPWDETLLIDADYVVNSTDLAKIFATTQDFMCFRTATHVASRDPEWSLNFFGRSKLPMFWATVIYFKKTSYSKMIFEYMNIIKQNWMHFCYLYSLGASTYRNDFALSIALHVINGHDETKVAIPWAMASVTNNCDLKQVDDTKFEVYYEVEKKLKKITLSEIDFHSLGKKSLGKICETYIGQRLSNTSC